MRHGRLIFEVAVAFAIMIGIAAHAQVLTVQYDNARTGATLTETTLTPANVNAKSFGKLLTLQVDGDVYAQPLVFPRLEIPGKGTHDVVFVATEHDSVYAFDAAGHPAEPLWHVSFADGSKSIPVPAADTNCPFIAPEVGITPTPVIDPQSGTLYVLARTKESTGFMRSAFVQRLHALAITSGAEKFGGPATIETPGFDPLRELPRAGLLLSNGQVYLTWASSCDVRPYHGWVMAYDAHTLKQTAVFNTSPDAGESGIWQGDDGPAVDAAGNVYVATGNGRFTVESGGHDYGDSLLKLRLSGGQLTVVDYFTPPDEERLNNKDLDLGSGGPVVVPSGTADHGSLVLIGGKDGVVRVIDPDHMRHGLQHVDLRGGNYASPAYWNGHLFFIGSNDVLKDYAVRNGRLSEEPVARGTQTYVNPGATPAVSASGTRNAIVWAIETKVWNAWNTDRPSVLHAYDAADVSREIYTSEQNPTRDRVGNTVRFTIPTIANGRVYVPARHQVDVYGLLGKSQ